MRIAAIYDIHGNLPALEAVLHEIEQAAPDLIVVGGDVAAGPLPRPTIERLMQLGPQTCFIRGNADRYMVQCFDGVPLAATTPALAREVTAWAARQLDRVHRDFLDSFIERAVLPVDGLGEVLFCHATPRNDEELFTAASPDERLRPMLAGVAQPTVVCGHTHMQFERIVDGIRIVNAGSVGMPYGPPGAYWLLLGPAIMLRRTSYDLERAAALIRRSGYPQADDFADHNMLAPPSAAEATAVFEQMAQQAESR